MNTSYTGRTIAAVILAVLSLSILGGCSQKITGATVRKDMSPELETIALTKELHLNRKAAALDTTMRQLHDDWDSVWLNQRPSRMSRIVVP